MHRDLVLILVHGACGRVHTQPDDAANQDIARRHALEIGGDDRHAVVITVFAADDVNGVFSFFQIGDGGCCDGACADGIGGECAGGTRHIGRVDRHILRCAAGDAGAGRQTEGRAQQIKSFHG